MNPKQKARMGRPPLDNKPTTRGIRLTDQHWQVFKDHLGPEWLRKKIDEVIAKQNKQIKPSI